MLVGGVLVVSVRRIAEDDRLGGAESPNALVGDFLNACAFGVLPTALRLRSRTVKY